jgi:hypothetical protein
LLPAAVVLGGCRATGIAPFVVGFVLTPLASNSSEFVSSLTFAARKKRKNMSLTLSQVGGADSGCGNSSARSRVGGICCACGTTVRLCSKHLSLCAAWPPQLMPELMLQHQKRHVCSCTHP